MAKKQTIVFDKNIAGKRQQDNNVKFSNAATPTPKEDKPTPSNTNGIGKTLEFLMILIVGAVSILIACVSIFNSIRNVIQPSVLSQPSQLVITAPVVLPQNTPNQVTTITMTQPPKTPEPTIKTNDPGQLNGGITTQQKKYHYSASRGDGVTHLARRAMLDYLNDNHIQLNGQQKLYFETNLTQKSNPVYLEVGDSRDFDHNLLAQLAREALSLSPKQQAAWNKYLRNYPLR